MGKIHLSGSDCLRPGAFTQTKSGLKSTSDPDQVTCAFCRAAISLSDMGIEVTHSRSDDQWLIESVMMSDKFNFDSEGMIVFAFGKHKDLFCVNYPDFLDWMVRTPSFDATDRGIAELIRKNSSRHIEYGPNEN